MSSTQQQPSSQCPLPLSFIEIPLKRSAAPYPNPRCKPTLDPKKEEAAKWLSSREKLHVIFFDGSQQAGASGKKFVAPPLSLVSLKNTGQILSEGRLADVFGGSHRRDGVFREVEMCLDEFERATEAYIIAEATGGGAAPAVVADPPATTKDDTPKDENAKEGSDENKPESSTSSAKRFSFVATTTSLDGAATDYSKSLTTSLRSCRQQGTDADTPTTLTAGKHYYFLWSQSLCAKTHSAGCDYRYDLASFHFNAGAMYANCAAYLAQLCCRLSGGMPKILSPTFEGWQDNGISVMEGAYGVQNALKDGYQYLCAAAHHFDVAAALVAAAIAATPPMNEGEESGSGQPAAYMPDMTPPFLCLLRECMIAQAQEMAACKSLSQGGVLYLPKYDAKDSRGQSTNFEIGRALSSSMTGDSDTAFTSPLVLNNVLLSCRLLLHASVVFERAVREVMNTKVPFDSKSWGSEYSIFKAAMTLKSSTIELCVVGIRGAFMATPLTRNQRMVYDMRATSAKPAAASATLGSHPGEKWEDGLKWLRAAVLDSNRVYQRALQQRAPSEVRAWSHCILAHIVAKHAASCIDTWGQSPSSTNVSPLPEMTGDPTLTPLPVARPKAYTPPQPTSN